MEKHNNKKLPKEATLIVHFYTSAGSRVKNAQNMWIDLMSDRQENVGEGERFVVNNTIEAGEAFQMYLEYLNKCEHN